MAKSEAVHPSPWVRTGEPLLWLGGAGHEVRGPDYYFDCRDRTGRPHVCLQLTLSGQGFYADARGRRLLPAGWAFLQTIPGPFEYGHAPAPDGAAYELVWVGMMGEAAGQWQRRIGAIFGQVLNLGLDGPVAPLLLAIARQRQEGTRPDRYLMSAQLYQLLMTVLSQLNQSRLQTSPLVARAMALIQQHGHDSRFGVSTLAQHLDCSREYLARRFREGAGVSPSDYLLQHRLRLATQALRRGGEKLETLARQSGFAGANYFCRVFRRHAGLTPAQFRRRPWMVGP